jgi:formate hydrogenlyase subunit 6/NADH:ubiquinone oxidoreductase subunit I
MFCGLCVESCPFDAIVMGHDFELATSDPTALTRTLITGEPAAGRKRAAAEGGDAS